MRMWNVDPKLLCHKHLLGEHLEMHMFLNVVSNNKPIAGYIKNGLVDLNRIIDRHDELPNEMKDRGYNHRSTISEKDADIVRQYSSETAYSGHVDIGRSLRDLKAMCDECAMRIMLGLPEVAD